MIDVSEYIERLEQLRVRMSESIERRYRFIVFMDLFDNYGIIMPHGYL
jgi:hypothetical protein